MTSMPGARTPPESVADTAHKPQPKLVSTPIPGDTYKLIDHATGKILTLRNGEMIMATKEDAGGSSLWICGQMGGWLTFKNPVSGRYLGYHVSQFQILTDGSAWCVEPRAYRENEYFVVQAHPHGGSVLSQQHRSALYDWSLREGYEGAEKIGFCLSTAEEFHERAIVWDFYKVVGN